MKGKILVGVLFGLMLLGIANAAFSEEQPKPQAQDLFVLKDIQPVGDESNGRVPLMGDDRKKDMDGLTTDGIWRTITVQPVQSFEAPGWKEIIIPPGITWGTDLKGPTWFHGRLIFFLPKGEDFRILSESNPNWTTKMLCIYSVGAGYRWEIIFGEHTLPIWFGHDVEHVIQGKLTLLGHTFVSDQDYPLTFKLVKDHGYVYLCGRGMVATPNGKTHSLGYDDTVDAWLLRMKSEDLLDKESAAQALGYLAKTTEEKDKAVPTLIKVLEDKVMEVRRNAAEALGRLRDERVMEDLVPLLKDSESEWWVAAVAASEKNSSQKQLRKLPTP